MDSTWRKAAIAVTVVAALELVVLAGAAMALLGNPLARHLKAEAASAAAPRVRSTTAALPTKTTLERAETSVVVLNANGQAGAAATEADRVQAKGYLIGSVGNAPAGNVSRTLVMYRPGYAAEGARLAHDLHIRHVRPLDGMRPGQLMGAHLVLILGT